MKLLPATPSAMISSISRWVMVLTPSKTPCILRSIWTMTAISDTAPGWDALTASMAGTTRFSGDTGDGGAILIDTTAGTTHGTIPGSMVGTTHGIMAGMIGTGILLGIIVAGILHGITEVEVDMSIHSRMRDMTEDKCQRQDVAIPLLQEEVSAEGL